MILSNAGVIPREWENYYPYAAYDWDPSLEWDEIMLDYRKTLYERLSKFIINHSNEYKNYMCYLRPESDTYAVIKDLEKKMLIQIPNFCKNELTDSELDEISLGGIYDDCDHVLLNQANLDNLSKTIINLLASK